MISADADEKDGSIAETDRVCQSLRQKLFEKIILKIFRIVELNIF